MFVERTRRLNDHRRQIDTNGFADAERMHAIQEVSPHETITAPAEYIKSGAARDHDSGLLPINVKKALQKPLPFLIFVQFVKHHDGRGGPQPLEMDALGNSCGPA